MSRDLMHSDEVKALVRDAYRHVPPTTAAVAQASTAPKSWRWCRIRPSSVRWAWRTICATPTSNPAKPSWTSAVGAGSTRSWQRSAPGPLAR